MPPKLPPPTKSSTTKGKSAKKGIQDINQAFKERDVAAKAKELGIPYVNLLSVPVNPDLANVIEKDVAVAAQAVCFYKSGKKIRLAVVNSEKAETKKLLADLKAQEYEIAISICSEESLASAHKMYTSEVYEKHEVEENVFEEDDLGSFADEIENMGQLKEKIENSSYDVALNYVQVGSYKTGSSDLHFQPEEDHVLVRFRIDGVLKPIFELSHKIYNGILKEIKYLSHLKLNITNIPQDGQYSFNVNKKQINVRVSIMPSHYGETVVMRLLDSQKTFADFTKLGFEGNALEHLKEAINLPHGMILMTGPTGSGKTTTLYSMLQAIDTQTKKVITLEDPVEYNLAGITQSQIQEEVDYTFASGLRAILRQDPDVIMVGEIRDLETAETAAQASLTGHLVFSTLHTNSAVESIPRLVNMGVKAFILAPAIDLIIAQRLVRKLCPECTSDRAITEVEKTHIQETLQKIQEKGIEAPAMPTTLKEAKGCDKCATTGFQGMMTVAEVLRFTEGLRNLILEQKPMPEIYDWIDKNAKMLTMHEDGVLKVVRGFTTLDEVYRVAAA